MVLTVEMGLEESLQPKYRGLSVSGARQLGPC